MADIDAALEQQIFPVPSLNANHTYITASGITPGDELK